MLDKLDHFCPSNQQEWRTWLEENHISKDNIWLITYKKNTGKPTLTWSESVDEALCFGWIDSLKRPIDEEKSMQFFSKRKKNSTWSKINKDKVAYLIESGRMMDAGHRTIEIAKENGSWSILDEVEALIVPEDLENKFKEFEGAKDYFERLSRSVKKGLLQWIVMAKRAETRERRISEIAENAGQNRKPKSFR